MSPGSPIPLCFLFASICFFKIQVSEQLPHSLDSQRQALGVGTAGEGTSILVGPAAPGAHNLLDRCVLTAAALGRVRGVQKAGRIRL